jgi:hypothetical protein
MFKTDEAPLWLHLAAVAVILAPMFALLALTDGSAR